MNGGFEVTLPILTSEEDVLAIVEYLKTKATGATIEEAKAVMDKKLLDGNDNVQLYNV
ncbi:hypothetical protein ACFSL6_03050 [Paenibacillus thailandensis]|uniref:Cytochrome c domain-containing protein n=1 Tax=Paenibacillus thailandensis TaxID=393250 RepID=A0ABW5R589_9BACL